MRGHVAGDFSAFQEFWRSAFTLGLIRLVLIIESLYKTLTSLHLLFKTRPLVLRYFPSRNAFGAFGAFGTPWNGVSMTLKPQRSSKISHIFDLFWRFA
jgi:hypothetical protein